MANKILPKGEQIISITGVIITADGEDRTFEITRATWTGEGNRWSQWGNVTDKLGNTVEALSAITTALTKWMH